MGRLEQGGEHLAQFVCCLFGEHSRHRRDRGSPNGLISVGVGA